MIVAVEGPDLCGKSALFEGLRGRVDATFVPRLPLDPRLLPYMDAVEARNEALWAALYDPTRLYISDRHFAVSDPVYSRLFGRPIRDYSRWYPELRVVYLDAPLEVLFDRHMRRGDNLVDMDRLSQLPLLYEATLNKLLYVTKLDTSLPVEQLARVCARCIREWRSDEASDIRGGS